MKETQYALELIAHEVARLIGHVPTNLASIGVARKNATFTFMFDKKTWLVKIYGAPYYEMKGEKEAFFLEKIFPILYPSIPMRVIYQGNSTTLGNSFVLIREFIDAEPVKSIDWITFNELSDVLDQFHYSTEIRAIIREKTRFHFDELGEFIGKTLGIENYSTKEKYFHQAYLHWIDNISKAKISADELTVATTLWQVMLRTMDSLSAEVVPTHGDIKAANLLRLSTDNRLVVIDFESVFSFFAEYDYVPLIFARGLDRRNAAVACTVEPAYALSEIFRRQAGGRSSIVDIQRRLWFLTSYAFLRFWNFSVRVKQPSLSNEVIALAQAFLKDVSELL